MTETPVTIGLLISLALVLIAIIGIVARGLSLFSQMGERVARLETKVDRLVAQHNGGHGDHGVARKKGT